MLYLNREMNIIHRNLMLESTYLVEDRILQVKIGSFELSLNQVNNLCEHEYDIGMAIYRVN